MGRVGVGWGGQILTEPFYPFVERVFRFTAPTDQLNYYKQEREAAPTTARSGWWRAPA